MVNPLMINGIEYNLVEYPLTKTVEIQDHDHRPLYEAVEDITGEYMEFYKDSEYIATSPHIGNFEGVVDCVEWFLGSESDIQGGYF